VIAAAEFPIGDNEMKNRVEEIFHELADLPVDARARYFTRQGIDTKTRSEVEALLLFDAASNTSLERDIEQVAQRALARFEPKGMLSRRYLIGEFLGRGGMGTVYSAERVDGELSQRVAVKFLRPGVDDPQLRQRFLAERQILATLSHPNIARLLDAGHREDGQPYLVMEYVAGKPIDIYTNGLSIRPKIDLFLKVCSAVGYLHRNLVVHRDLKPANILVTEEREPKLLDFGIAKMLDLAADSTVTAMRMLTPDYASPEQVDGSLVSTATDIYSMGAVLYKLLTGRSPHHFDSDSASAIALAISSGSIIPPARLVPALKGDLEFIVLKALRREPQERYATIEQLAEDLENFLQSRPIRARTGDAWYRTRKLLRRYWLPVAASVLAVAGLSAGVLVANHQRAIAQRRFVQVRQLANKLFDIDVAVRGTPGTTKVRELIVDTSLDYLQRLATDAQGDPELELELGNAYMRVARVQGVPISANLGQMERAEQNLKRADGFIRSVLAVQPANRLAMLRSAQIAHDRMILARQGGRHDEALEWAGKSAAWLEKYHAGTGDKSEAPAILHTYLNVADQHMLSRRFDDALRLCRHASDLARSFGNQSYLGTFLWVSADVFRRQGDLDKALEEIHQSVKILESAATAGDQGPKMNLNLALIFQARILGEDQGISLGRPEEAAATLERSFSASDTFVHKDPNDQNARGNLAMAGINLANILRHSDPKRAMAIYDHTLNHLGEIGNNSSFRRYEVNALAGSTYPLLELGRPAEARQRLDAAFERLRQLNAYPAEKIRPGSEADSTLCALADYESKRGELQGATEIYEDLLHKVEAWGPKPETFLADAIDLSRISASLAALNRRVGRHDRASRLEAWQLNLWLHWETRLPRSTVVRRQLTAVKSVVH
jgi:tRNA A-37 threonylcarbamoyl transferase component Bud32/tetratricopeptide (TPR) repeat protein